MLSIFPFLSFSSPVRCMEIIIFGRKDKSFCCLSRCNVLQIQCAYLIFLLIFFLCAIAACHIISVRFVNLLPFIMIILRLLCDFMLNPHSHTHTTFIQFSNSVSLFCSLFVCIRIPLFMLAHNFIESFRLHSKIITPFLAMLYPLVQCFLLSDHSPWNEIVSTPSRTIHSVASLPSLSSSSYELNLHHKNIKVILFAFNIFLFTSGFLFASFYSISLWHYCCAPLLRFFNSLSLVSILATTTTIAKSLVCMPEYASKFRDCMQTNKQTYVHKYMNEWKIINSVRYDSFTARDFFSICSCCIQIDTWLLSLLLLFACIFLLLTFFTILMEVSILEKGYVCLVLLSDLFEHK